MTDTPDLPEQGHTGAPLSRRELRELAGRDGAPAPGSESETAPGDGSGAQAGTTGASSVADAHPVDAAAATPAAGVGGSSDAAAGRPAAASMTLDDLFTADRAVVPDKAERTRSRRRGALIWLVLMLVVFGGIAAGATYVWLNYEAQIRSFLGWEEPRDFEAGMATGEALVTISSGDLPPAISESLYRAGVTKTPNAFYAMLIDTKQNPTFYPGVYALQKQMTSVAALEALQDPANKQEHTALIREGLTLEQTLPYLSEGLGIPIEDFQAAVADPAAYGVPADSLEGWLFPALYEFDPGVTATDVIGRMVTRMVTELGDQGVPEDRRQEVLTIASIIQREARIEEDFYKVSRVIQNRLDVGMRLQMDSTAQFGYKEHTGSASSSGAALEDQNEWNTYVIDGLPKGPIAGPGATAIDAALHPADGDWLFFVTWNMDTGETIFTETDAKHEEAKQKWFQWCRENDNRGC